jgi:hypothetical protein
MSDQPTQPTAVPSPWLAAVVHLLSELAGEGISMEGCDDPADLMSEIADHLGCGDEDDPWLAVVGKLAGVSHA